jgi:hypothetical protein
MYAFVLHLSLKQKKDDPTIKQDANKIFVLCRGQYIISGLAWG